MNAYDNTLYVLTQGAYLAKDGERVVVRVENETRLGVPLHTLGGIVTFGAVSASPFLLGAAAERGVCVSMFTEHGRFLARVEGPVSGNILLRKAQYRRGESPTDCARLAAAFVSAKLANQRTVLTRQARERPDGAEPLREAAAHLARTLDALWPAAAGEGGTLDTDRVRGDEGQAAATYFGVFDRLITAQKEDFAFSGRNRHPPRDPVNALLSFVYTLLTHDVRSALEGVGLDPQAGFLHRDRPGRPGLALDMMEELRPVMADRLVLSLINRQQVKGKGFKTTASGAVEMTEETRKTVLTAYQERKREEIRHPFLDETMKWGLVPHVQARLLARHLRGELEAYPAFVWR
jgi:CRISPR-associated protein Cas1